MKQAATIIQLFWKRRLSRAALKLREEAVLQQKIDERKKQEADAVADRVQERLTKEKDDRIAAIRLGLKYEEISEEERQRLLDHDEAEVTRLFDMKEERDRIKKEKLGLSANSGRNPFESRQELMSLITKTRTSERWLQMKSIAFGEACVSKLNISLIGARNLLNSDETGKSDPYVVVRRYYNKIENEEDEGDEGNGQDNFKRTSMASATNQLYQISKLKSKMAQSVPGNTRKPKDYEVVFKSKIKNDTLNPDWNVNFSIPIPDTWSDVLQPQRRRFRRQHPDHPLNKQPSGSGNSAATAAATGGVGGGLSAAVKKQDRIKKDKFILLEFLLYDYDEDSRNDPLGSVKMKIRLKDVSYSMEFTKMPVMLKTKNVYSGQSSLAELVSGKHKSNKNHHHKQQQQQHKREPGGKSEAVHMEVQKGWLLFGFCLEEAELEVPKEVNTDMFRASCKLLCLLTEPGDWGVDYAQRNARHLMLNGGAVPIVSGISGEFSDGGSF
jgi:hypothetical protein